MAILSALPFLQAFFSAWVPLVRRMQRPKAKETGAEKVMYTTGAVLSSVVYCPAKTIYSIGGHVVGGAAYLLTGGNKQTSRRIFDNAVKGDYFVLPSHLKGEKDLRFVGGSE